MIGHRRVANGTEQNGIERAQLLDAVFGHHLPMLEVMGAGEGEFAEGAVEIKC